MSTNALVPFTFNDRKLFTLTIDGKSWTRAKEICESLEYNKVTSKTANIIRAHCSIENITQKCQLIGVHESCTPVLWPADSQKYDLYINEQGMYELVFKSEQNLAKDFQDYCFNVMFPQIRDHFEQLAINEKDREHQLAIEDVRREHQLAIANREREHQQVIEEKDDEIQNLIQNRHVPHIGEHDNILCAIDKNTAEEHHPYYMIRCQRMRLQKRINILRAKYPDMIIKRPEYDAANAVICWVRFKQYIGRENYHRNHFSLDEDSRDVFEDTFDIQM